MGVTYDVYQYKGKIEDHGQKDALVVAVDFENSSQCIVCDNPKDNASVLPCISHTQ